MYQYAIYISDNWLYMTMKRTQAVQLNTSRIRDKTLENYISNISTMNKTTAREYLFRLKNFRTFIKDHCNVRGLDDVISQIQNKQKDPYHLLNSYCSHLVGANISPSYTKNCTITVKNFFEYYDVELSPRKFKMKV